MTKNKRIVWLFGIVAVIVVIGLYVFFELYRSFPRTVACDDGPRQTIDIRDFVTQYSSYSVELESRIGSSAAFSGKIDPVQLQSLTEAAQQSNEFRKFLVAGYNSCAISKDQYAKFGARFQALDGLARQINSLAAKASLDGQEQQNLADLVTRYVELTTGLGES